MKNSFLNLRAMLLLAVLLCGGISAFADTTIWQDSIQYKLQSDLTAYVSDAKYDIKNANIPEKITYENKDYTVTRIGGSAFQGCSSLASVVIPSSVTSIGYYAFNGCSSLASVVIPSSVTSIESGTFEGCSSLLEYRLKSDFTADVYDAGDSIITANIPEKITYEGKYYTVTRIRAFAFKGCSSLVSVVIPNSVTSIESYAFSGCSSLASVVISNSVKSISDYTFLNCGSLRSVTIGAGVQYIAGSAFANKTYDGYNYIRPEKAIWLGNTPPEGYKNVNGIYNYVSNDSFTSLSNTKVYPFLSSMFEKDGIKYVPVNPSERTCDAIDCAYDSTAANINIGKTVNYKGVKLAVKDIRPYTCYDNKYIKTVKIDYGGAIGNYAFIGCNSIASADIAATKIGDNAFTGCSKLEDAVLGESLKSIGDNAFSGTSLKGISIPDSVASIGGRCFSGCASLTYAKIGAGVSVIPNRAFYSCKSLPEITIPKTVDSIGNDVFYGCISLADVTIADRETELKLGSNGSSPMFSSCPLKSVYIGGNITYGTTANDGYSPFYRNTSLETVRITDKETEISENEFYGCTSLKSVSMGDGIDTIGKYAFSGCSALESFSFGTGLKSIGDEAFSDCTGMKKLVSKTATPPVCGPQALDDINKWECTLYVPQESLDAYKSAAQWKEFFFLETGIKDVPNTSSSATESARYSTDGTRIASPQKGINIIRMSDGTVKKVLVK